jgi:hypothetical protein
VSSSRGLAPTKPVGRQMATVAESPEESVDDHAVLPISSGIDG